MTYAHDLNESDRKTWVGHLVHFKIKAHSHHIQMDLIKYLDKLVRTRFNDYLDFVYDVLIGELRELLDQFHALVVELVGLLNVAHGKLDIFFVVL